MDKIKDFLSTKAGKITAIAGGGVIAALIVVVMINIFGENIDTRDRPEGPDSENMTDPDAAIEAPVDYQILGHPCPDTGNMLHPSMGVDVLSVSQDGDNLIFTNLITNEVVSASNISLEANGDRIITLALESGETFRVRVAHGVIESFLNPPDDNPPDDPNGGNGQPADPAEVFNPRTNYTVRLNNANTDVNHIPRLEDGTRAVQFNVGDDGTAVLRIRAAGNFTLTGTMSNGEVVVGHNNDDISIGAVNLTLRNANITNRNGPAIRAIRTVESLTITNASGSTNTLVDQRGPRPNEDEFENNPEDFPNARNATVFTREVPLTITGSGTMNITAGFAHGIHARGNQVTIRGARINVTRAHANGIRARRSIVIDNSRIDISSGNKGVRAGGSQHGNIVIRNNSTLNITSAGDAVHAEVNLTVNNSTINATTGGGWQQGSLEVQFSRTGLRATGDISVTGGTISLNCARDGFNTSGVVNINGANLTVSAHRRGVRGQRGVVLANTTTRIEMSRIALHGGSLPESGGRAASHVRIVGGTVHLRFTETAFNRQLPSGTPPDNTFTWERV
jgi:hypothetical protein